MLNKKPIFIVGFTRGGTNILQNLLRSHPGVCMPRGELQQVFYGTGTTHFLGRFRNRHIRNLARIRLLPILSVERSDIFSLNHWEPRKPLAEWTKRFIDRKLFYDKIKADGVDENLYKSENVKYTAAERAAARLMTKNLNGLIFLSQELAKMYPDATFIAIIRNGLALGESHIRRGWHADQFAKCYKQGCMQIMRDAASLHNYHIIRFEDILERPYQSLELIYSWAGLDLRDVEMLRMSDKPVIDSSGNHSKIIESDTKSSKYFWSMRKIHWMPKSTFGKLFEQNVNDNQIQRLSKSDKEIILKYCESVLSHFKYI